MGKNEMKVIFESCSENESFARMVIAAFAARLDPTLEELADIKTAVSEAVTNSIIHGYGGGEGSIEMRGMIDGMEVTVEIVDFGVGIEDIPKAMEPMFTTRPDIDRSGMGFAFMEAFMDELKVESEPGKGTKVCMKKRLSEV
ncbi:MAG: anti-sigma F factor [Clostridia bacterium]|nr:anti-sigma F factor [Lachnospiraceae bacterium]NCC00402.1 anti-sigma F factor [Clostridia bacterium]NCD02601.1 anti-sigma F factor [Clostridia bacterium]